MALLVSGLRSGAHPVRISYCEGRAVTIFERKKTFGLFFLKVTISKTIRLMYSKLSKIVLNLYLPVKYLG